MNDEFIERHFEQRQLRLDKAKSLTETMSILNEPYPAEMAEEFKTDQFSRTDGNIRMLEGRKCKGAVYVTYNPHWQCEVIEVGFETIDNGPGLSGGFIALEGKVLPARYARILREAGLDIYDTVTVL